MKPREESLLQRLAIWAGWAGMALALAGLALLSARPDWGRYVTLLELAALALLVVFFAVHFEAVKDISTRRSTRLGLNSALMAVIFIAILGIVNFLSKRHSVQWDLSETAEFTLAPQTTEMLANLKRDVKITGFSQEGSPTRDRLKDLLNGYTYHSHKISYQFVDPDKRPTLAKQYGITQYDTLVVESQGQETQVKNASEQEITNALIRVTRDGKRQVRFLDGHGERGLDDTERQGFSMAKDALVKQGYDVAALSLLQEGRVPDGTSVLVIAGPDRPLLPEEQLAIADYLAAGGKLLLLLDPGNRARLEDFLAGWGLRLGAGVVVDTLSRLFGGDFTTPIVTTYPPHEITEGFNLATFFPLAAPIEFDPAQDKQTTFQPLAQTSSNSWAETDPNAGELKFEPGADRAGPLTLAAVVTPRAGANADPLADTGAAPGGAAALALFGDADFASNSHINFSGNLDLFLNTVSWLTQEKDLISIRPKEARFAPLFLSSTQGKIVMYVSLIVAPATVFLSGLVIWRRRRRL
jgi:ABC-type uncharacterized transport system involved in gliding motility auxiliary subunit